MSSPIVSSRTASDGYQFAVSRWVPAGTCRGHVVILHGIQSHAGWYGYSANALCDAGYAVWFPDRRGSGRNEQSRGDAPSWQRLVNDVVHVLNDVQAEQDATAERTPTFLIGLSWGGKLAATVASLRAELLSGLVLLYPGIVARVRPTAWQHLRMNLGETLGVRDRMIRIPLDDPRLFTSVPKWQEFIRDDPLALREVTSGFLYENRRLDRLAQGSAPYLTMPSLLMLAGGDEIVDNEAVERFFQGVAATDRTVVTYPEARHTLEFEPGREQYVADLINWLQERSPS